ncbi:MAG: hypothetical protein GXO67_05875, partial [Archaeoglobi archaeon]|nr:hypothetical protein [Archaeoglobi archaeon]
GGVYPGLVYVLEAPGAGGREFAYSMLHRNRERERFVISITATEKDVRREVQLMYPEIGQSVLEGVRIVSLAELYFQDSIIPMKWVSGKASAESLRRRDDILSGLIKTLDSLEDGSVVVLDSVTDLVRLSGRRLEWEDIVDLLNGLRKIGLRKDCVILALLTSSVLDPGRENELLSSSDGIAVFEWVEEKGSLSRWMHFRKLLGIMPMLEREKVSRLQIRTDPRVGFAVTTYERVI